MAMLLSHENEFQNLNMNKVIRMCLIHDLGEAFTGDIPTFEKSRMDEKKEGALFYEWVSDFPEEVRIEWISLLDEMCALETKEAKTYKALDKLEAVIAHDEADICTWLPLEYDLQKTYGKDNVTFSPYLTELKQVIDEMTEDKIANEKKQSV